MNKVLVPKITFVETTPDEKRIEAAYSRIFEMARRNILARKQLTTNLSKKYTEVHDGN